MHHEIEKFTHTTTTTTTNTIKFHADGCYRDSEDSDSNHSTTPPPSSAGSAHGAGEHHPLTPTAMGSFCGVEVRKGNEKDR